MPMFKKDCLFEWRWVGTQIKWHLLQHWLRTEHNIGEVLFWRSLPRTPISPKIKWPLKTVVLQYYTCPKFWTSPFYYRDQTWFFMPREVLKTKAGGRGFQHLPRDLANVNALKKHARSLLLNKKWKHLLISRYFEHYFVSPFHWFLANTISTGYARSRAGH